MILQNLTSTQNISKYQNIIEQIHLCLRLSFPLGAVRYSHHRHTKLFHIEHSSNMTVIISQSTGRLLVIQICTLKPITLTSVIFSVLFRCWFQKMVYYCSHPYFGHTVPIFTISRGSFLSRWIPALWEG